MTELVRVPSSKFYKLLDQIAENEKTTRDCFEEALTLARREKFTDLEIALLMKDYLKDKIPKTTLWRMTKALEPKEEIEESTSQSVPMEQIVGKKEPEQSDHDWHYEQGEKEEERMEKIEEQKKAEQEPEEPTELELANIKIAQLEDALHKTEQFKPATQLQEKPLLDAVLDDDTVFKYLKSRAKETGDILDFGRVGSGALVQALAQYKNSFGVVELFGRVVKK